MAEMEAEMQALQTYVKTWKYTLFTDFSDDDIKYMSTMELRKNMWYTDANFTAAAMLLKGEEDLSRIQRYIEHALQANPKSIHAWCNQALYFLRQEPSQAPEAKEAIDKMERLLKQEKPRKDAELEQAYWQHSRQWSQELKEKALQAFETTFSRGQPLDDSHRYHYIKMLRSELKKYKSFKAREGTAQKMVNQLALFAASEEATYKLELWRSLANLLCSKNLWAKLNKSGLYQAIGRDSIDLLLCVDQLVEIQKVNLHIPIYSNFYADLARFLLLYSFGLNNKEERIKQLNEALKFCEKSLRTEASPIDKGPARHAEILLWLWAIHYDQEHTAEVELYIQEKDTPDPVFHGLEGDSKRWNYLVQCYYPSAPDNSPKTRPLLEETRSIIEGAMKPGCRTAPVFYPKVLMLLGESQEGVEKSFDNIWFAESNQHVNWSQQGMFYETVGELDKAKEYYQNVLRSRCRGDQVSYRMAVNGNNRLEKLLASAENH